MKHRCIRENEDVCKEFDVCKLFVESQWNSLEIEYNINLVIQLNRRCFIPSTGFVIFINGKICTTIYQVFKAYEEQGLFQC